MHECWGSCIPASQDPLPTTSQLMACTLNVLQFATDCFVKRTVNKYPENYKKIKFSCSNSFIIQQHFVDQNHILVPNTTRSNITQRYDVAVSSQLLSFILGGDRGEQISIFSPQARYHDSTVPENTGNFGTIP